MALFILLAVLAPSPASAVGNVNIGASASYTLGNAFGYQNANSNSAFSLQFQVVAQPTADVVIKYSETSGFLTSTVGNGGVLVRPCSVAGSCTSSTWTVNFYANAGAPTGASNVFTLTFLAVHSTDANWNGTNSAAVSFCVVCWCSRSYHLLVCCCAGATLSGQTTITFTIAVSATLTLPNGRAAMYCLANNLNANLVVRATLTSVEPSCDCYVPMNGFPSLTFTVCPAFVCVCVRPCVFFGVLCVLQSCCVADSLFLLQIPAGQLYAEIAITLNCNTISLGLETPFHALAMQLLLVSITPLASSLCFRSLNSFLRIPLSFFFRIPLFL